MPDASVPRKMMATERRAGTTGHLGRNIWAPEPLLEEGTGPENPMSRDRCEGLGTAGTRGHELGGPWRNHRLLRYPGKEPQAYGQRRGSELSQEHCEHCE